MKLAATGATIDPEARYLDHEQVIRELDESERDHKLDAAGVIDKLKEAVATCQSAADRYKVRETESWRAGDAYIIARGKYLAEIKRRVKLPEGHNGHSLAVPERPGWRKWCANNGLALTHANACVAAAAGNMAPLERQRKAAREGNRRTRAKHPMQKIKDLWEVLTRAEREEFIRLVLSQKDYGLSPIKETRRASEFEAHA